MPELKLTVATTALLTPGEGRREHQRAMYDLMDLYLVPAVSLNGKAASRPRSHLPSQPFFDMVD